MAISVTPIDHHAQLLLDVVQVRADGRCGKFKSRAIRLHGCRRVQGGRNSNLCPTAARRATGRRVEFRQGELLGERGIEIAAAGGDPVTASSSASGALRFDRKPSAPSCNARRA